ncbi:hypothetical protein [Jiangella asiatica]|uniref:hypothetical protein n=1 Tax=Jiangella asiatica TaxID=2530372 RepID=UPI0013A5DF3F|nr:hypothetical protein [Jiangella asiatica]
MTSNRRSSIGTALMSTVRLLLTRLSVESGYATGLLVPMLIMGSAWAWRSHRSTS